jgi:hypothetical protein
MSSPTVPTPAPEPSDADRVATITANRDDLVILLWHAYGSAEERADEPSLDLARRLLIDLGEDFR